MSISTRFNFATGVTVNIVTTGPNFIGELIDEVFSNEKDNNSKNNVGINSFLIVRLTAATAPFVAGQVVRINTDEIIAIG